MALGGYQESFRGFEHYANNASNKEIDDSNSPLDVRIRNNIQKISHNDSELKTLVENIGTQFDSKDLRAKLKTKQSDTNSLLKITEALLKEYSQACPSDSKQQREWKVQQSRYKDMFHDVLKDNLETKKTLRTKERISLRESLASSGVQSAHIDESGNIVKDGEHIQMDSIKEEENLELIKQREEELKQLESDIVDINSMFKDLAVMVHDQGEEIDRAEKVVEEAVQNVEEGVKDLAIAADHTTAARKKMLLLLAVVVIVIALIVVIILVSM